MMEKFLKFTVGIIVGFVFGCVVMMTIKTNTNKIVQAQDKSEKIFEVSDKDITILGTNYIVTDKETGVQYIYIAHGYGAGLSPHYNADGTLCVKE